MTRSPLSSIEARALEARRALRSCVLCPRRCGVDRVAGERGYCGLDGRAFWFREMIHYGLEFELIPAHAIYLAGCNMRCVFCTAQPWNSAPGGANRWDTAAMKGRVEERRADGAATLFFVGGEPTASLHVILELLAAMPDRYRVAWDSNMYMTAEARELLRGVVDVYVADFKFGNDRCALAIADAPSYVESVTESLRFAEGTSSLIVRHLLMPGHLQCCTRPVLQWVRRELRCPRLALRGEYMPPARPCGIGGMDRYPTQGEYEQAHALARQCGIELVN